MDQQAKIYVAGRRTAPDVEGATEMKAAGNAPSVRSFEQLVGAVRQVHDELAAHASRAVNASLTLRNWLIGIYVEEYERKGCGGC